MIPLVSIIVPVYNVEKYLRQCLESLCNQSLREIEIIAVDDGSTDSSAAILDEFAARDARVYALHLPNRGAGAARNSGLEAAVGKYLYFSDPDDLVHPTYLKRLFSRAEKTSADIVVSDYLTCDLDTGALRRVSVNWGLCNLSRSEGVFSPKDLNWCDAEPFYQLSPIIWHKLFRRAFVVENNLRYQEIRRFNDMCFAYEALCRAQRIALLSGIGYLYFSKRRGSLQNNRSLSGEMIKEVMSELRRRLCACGLFDTFAAAFADLERRNYCQFSSRCNDAPAEPRKIRRGIHRLGEILRSGKRRLREFLRLELAWPGVHSLARNYPDCKTK